MASDVRERLPAVQGGCWSAVTQGPEPGLTASGTDSNPYENRLEPPWRSERPRCGVLQANRPPVHWTGRRRPRRSQELQSREVIDHMVINRVHGFRRFCCHVK